MSKIKVSEALEMFKEYKCSCITDPQPTIWKLSLPRHATFDTSPGEIIIHFHINQVKEQKTGGRNPTTYPPEI